MASLPQTLAQQIRKTLEQPGADNVHDLRVAIRRYNQALALDSRNNHTRILRRLKKTMRLAGEVRNADITGKLLSKLKRTTMLQRRIARRRGRAEARLLDALQRLSTHPFPQGLPAAPGQTSHPVVRAARRMFKRAAKAAAHSSDPMHLHRARIAAKKLRYTLEVVAPDHPRLEEIKQVQTDLGRINDYETAWTLVEEESGSKTVAIELKRKQAKKIREFHRYWARLFPDPATEHEWLREFSAIQYRPSRNVSHGRRSRRSPGGPRTRTARPS